MRTFLKKYVESRGTQSIIKNLILKKSKRSWNENFSERNGYTVQTNYFIFILSIFQIGLANVLCPFKILRRCTKKKKKKKKNLDKNPFTLFFQLSYFSAWTREPILMPTS